MADFHYQSNLRDIEFNLFEYLKIQDTTLGRGDFQSMDEDTAREALRGLQSICENELAESFVSADREGLTFDGKGNVTLPEGLKKSIAAWYENDWDLLPVPERLGGFGGPPTMGWAGWEMVSGANPPIAFYQFGTFLALVIDALGTNDQKKLYVENMIERHWGGSMVLTEPDAGSDVGAGRAKARQVEGDLYELEGIKSFITNGDYDATENIVHLVLARPEGAAASTKGLSMFIVPKFWVNDDGSLGERNGIVATSVEHKMGIKASATCELTLGAQEPCRGLLVGGVHDGIRQMFMVIEQARMSIGVKSASTLSTAYLNALSYAKERVQGPDLAKARDKDSPRVRIIEHPDVRRQLMRLKCHAEGLRALAFYAAKIQDDVMLLRAEGNGEEATRIDQRNDLLLPLIKGYGSEKAYELLSVALQVFGGSGYVMDYPMEQYIRDQKIDSLYEGTTHIQALDLFFRKIARDGGATLLALMEEIAATAREAGSGDALADERKALLTALEDVQGIFGALMAKVQESIYHGGLQVNRVLFSLSEIVIGWLLIEHATLAIEKGAGASGSEKAYYEGKVASARFFCRNVLPYISATRKIVEAGALDLMELDEAAF
jgi:alkylation response protein AidB-like acyl-CoA dehydrogenase